MLPGERAIAFNVTGSTVAVIGGAIEAVLGGSRTLPTASTGQSELVSPTEKSPQETAGLLGRLRC